MTKSRPLRLAFLLWYFPVLSETFVIEQITGMIKRGHHVDLFSLRAGDLSGLPLELRRFALEERMRHVPTPRKRTARIISAARLLASPPIFQKAKWAALNPWVHGKKAVNLEMFHTVSSFLRSGPYDVLHCHFGDLGIIGERLVRMCAVDAALVTSFRGADLSSHYLARPESFAALLGRGDLHLPVSVDFRQRLLDAGAPEDRVSLHHDGIDLKRFPFVEQRPGGDVTRLLFVGRLVPKKGVAYALDALAKVVQADHKVTLTIIGDGSERELLMERSRELALGEHVAFAGALPLAEVAQAMRSAHILLAPSVTSANGDQEGIPTVIKEAMAVGLPVVSTMHSGIPELVEHGVTGYLAPEGDTESLAKHLITLLNHPERWREMGRAGRRRVEAEFDTEQLNDTLVEHYREAMARRRANGTRDS